MYSSDAGKYSDKQAVCGFSMDVGERCRFNTNSQTVERIGLIVMQW